MAHPDPVRAQEQDVARCARTSWRNASRAPCGQAARACGAAVWPRPRGWPRGGAGLPRHGDRPARPPAAERSADPRALSRRRYRSRHPRRTGRAPAAAPARARPPGPRRGRPGHRLASSGRWRTRRHAGRPGMTADRPARGRAGASPAAAGLSSGHRDSGLGQCDLVCAVPWVGCQQVRRRRRHGSRAAQTMPADTAKVGRALAAA